jgi:acetyltransferase-like isoleucine patch superfamily enzyme
MKWLARLRTRLYRWTSLAQRSWYVHVWGMDIGHDVRISRSARLDFTNPRGVHIGDCTLISFDAAILSHDFVGGKHMDTWVGHHCFIGARALIMPGVRVGNHCIIGSGSVVTHDVPDNSVAVGNPARVIASDIVTGRWGIRNPAFLKKEGILP